MSERSTHRSRFFGVLAVCGGAIGLVGAFAGGCGGGVDTPAGTPDTGVADTLIGTDGPVILDGSKDTADASKPPPDTAETHYDAPGTLFDVEIPDLSFDGGTTAKGCYDCTLANCKDEVAACDKDERCRGIVLCITVRCAGDTTDFGCALGCATEFGVSSPSDPVAGKALAVGQCTQDHCGDKCPIPGGTDAGPADTKKAETSTAEAGGDSASSFKSAIPSGAPMSTDPKMIELAKQLSGSFGGNPELRQAVIDRMSH
ncbi:MAG: hypothetical protein ABI175_16440 [Polyangiales bacterium]